MQIQTRATSTTVEIGQALLWALTDMLQPTLALAMGPGRHSPASLARSVRRDLPATIGPVRDAIAAVEALHAGTGPSADVARQALDAWVGGIMHNRDTTPFSRTGVGAQEWVFNQVNVELRAVVDFASAVIPPPDLEEPVR